MNIKVGTIVVIKNRKDNYDGHAGVVRHADRYKNLYFVGEFKSQKVYYPSVLMDVTREQMDVLSMEEYPELYI